MGRNGIEHFCCICSRHIERSNRNINGYTERISILRSSASTPCLQVQGLQCRHRRPLQKSRVPGTLNPTPQPPSPTNDRTLTLATSLYTILSLYLRALLASKTVDRETSDGDVYRKAANTALGACMS